MTGYRACILYKALKLHFSTEYDFIKYHGKVKYSISQYQNNKHKYSFEKISKKFSNEELQNFFIANFLQNDKFWILDFATQESIDVFKEFNKKRQSLSYVFESDLINIFNEENHKLLFKCNEKYDLPLLLKKLLRGEVSLETLIIMDRYMKFITKWNSNIAENYLWPDIKIKLLKYKPFLKYDSVKFKKTLINSVKEFI